MEKLPLYELRISEDEDAIVDAIAMVDMPAIESNFLSFSQEPKMVFSTAVDPSKYKNETFSSNDEKMELLGAAMIPDMHIFRKGKPGMEDCYVYITKETIRQAAQIFMKKGLTTSMNLDHTNTDAKSYVFQSYIVDSGKGMYSPKGLDLADGSWVVGVKVTDKEVWQSIKEGKRAGFSVEGLFQVFEQKFKSTPVNKEEDEVDELLMKEFKKLSKTLSKTK